VPHGSVRYTAVRVQKPPVIDGVLDDPIWKTAPVDSHFLSKRSKPYGKPTAEPTSVQIAYDSENLYVAFTCAYSSVRTRDTTFSADENITLPLAESVAVLVDPLHDHASALIFAVSRAGARADAELTALTPFGSPDWNGIWEARTVTTPDSWTAEFRIPWGTMRLPAHDEPFDIGIQFRRREPIVGEFSMWSLEAPAAPGIFDVNAFGHLDGLERVRPDLRLYLQPYVAVAYDQHAGTVLARQYDFLGTQSNFRTYAGLYARLYPPGPVRLEVTANPDFSAVTPDQAVANFNRFELFYPETRPFFAEDGARFTFGDDGGGVGGIGLLFYSRRVGLFTDPKSGATAPVPILYGAKSVLRSGTTEVGVMNVGLSTPNPKVTLDDNVSVVRANQVFGEGSHAGGIFLGRTGNQSNYAAGGVDALVSLYKRHLQIGGFLARTATEGAASSGMGEATLAWADDNFNASAKYLDIGTALDDQLGFVPTTGIRETVFSAAYTPNIRSDLVQRFFLEGDVDLARDRGGDRVFDRAAVIAHVLLIDGGSISVYTRPSIEKPTAPFDLFEGKVRVASGQYTNLTHDFTFSTSIRKPVYFGLGYTTGDFFAGLRDAPSATFGLNLGRFSASSYYQMNYIRYTGQELYGSIVRLTSAYFFTPEAKSTLVVQTDNLENAYVVQFLTTYAFGSASRLQFVVSKSTAGKSIPAYHWATSEAPLTAILSFAYGLTPF
jgi:hypothetical protein